MNTIKNGKIVKIPQDEYDRMFHPIRYAEQKEKERIATEQCNPYNQNNPKL